MLLRSASVLRGHIKPIGWLLLSSEGAGKDREVDVVGRRGGRVEEGRGGQQSMRDDTDAPFLVCLLLAPVLHVRNKCASSSCVYWKLVERNGDVNGADATASESRSEQQGATDYNGSLGNVRATYISITTY